MTIKRIYSYEDEAGDTLIVERFDDDTPPGVMVSAHSKHRVVPVSLPQDEARKLAEALDPEKTATAWNTLIAELDAAEKRTEAYRVENHRLTNKIAAIQEPANTRPPAALGQQVQANAVHTWQWVSAGVADVCSHCGTQANGMNFRDTCPGTKPSNTPPAPDRGADDRSEPPPGYLIHESTPDHWWWSTEERPEGYVPDMRTRAEAVAGTWADLAKRAAPLTAPAEARARAMEERLGEALSAADGWQARAREAEREAKQWKAAHDAVSQQADAIQASDDESAAIVAEQIKVVDAMGTEIAMWRAEVERLTEATEAAPKGGTPEPDGERVPCPACGRMLKPNYLGPRQYPFHKVNGERCPGSWKPAPEPPAAPTEPDADARPLHDRLAERAERLRYFFDKGLQPLYALLVSEVLPAIAPAAAAPLGAGPDPLDGWPVHDHPVGRFKAWLERLARHVGDDAIRTALSHLRDVVGTLAAPSAPHKVDDFHVPPFERRRMAEALYPEHDRGRLVELEAALVEARAVDAGLRAQLAAAEKRVEAHRVEIGRLTTKVAALQEPPRGVWHVEPAQRFDGEGRRVERWKAWTPSREVVVETRAEAEAMAERWNGAPAYMTPEHAPPAPDRGAEDDLLSAALYYAREWEKYTEGRATKAEHDAARATLKSATQALAAPAREQAAAAEARAEQATRNIMLAQQFRHSDSVAWHESRERLKVEHARQVDAARAEGVEQGRDEGLRQGRSTLAEEVRDMLEAAPTLPQATLATIAALVAPASPKAAPPEPAEFLHLLHQDGRTECGIWTGAKVTWRAERVTCPACAPEPPAAPPQPSPLPRPESTSPECERAMLRRTTLPRESWGEGYRCGWLDRGAAPPQGAGPARAKLELALADAAHEFGLVAEDTDHENGPTAVYEAAWDKLEAAALALAAPSAPQASEVHAIGLDSPAPLCRVLDKLTEGVGLLLDGLGWDGHYTVNGSGDHNDTYFREAMRAGLAYLRGEQVTHETLTTPAHPDAADAYSTPPARHRTPPTNAPQGEPDDDASAQAASDAWASWSGHATAWDRLPEGARDGWRFVARAVLRVAASPDAGLVERCPSTCDGDRCDRIAGHKGSHTLGASFWIVDDRDIQDDRRAEEHEDATLIAPEGDPGEHPPARSGSGLPTCGRHRNEHSVVEASMRIHGALPGSSGDPLPDHDFARLVGWLEWRTDDDQWAPSRPGMATLDEAVRRLARSAVGAGLAHIVEPLVRPTSDEPGEVGGHG